MVSMAGEIAAILKRHGCRIVFAALMGLYPGLQLMAEQDIFVIDERTAGDATSAAGNPWNFITDGVMGGVSAGQLGPALVAERPCLRLQGEVRLDNNGGFIQAAIDIPDDVRAVIADFTGILVDVYGNGEAYNLHLRTRDLWLPWQAYRTTFTATPQWQTLRLPFDQFTAYRTGKALDPARLKRIGIVAIGRAFTADVCIARLGLYR